MSKENGLVGRHVTWVDDLRPLPGDLRFSEEAAKDMSLVVKRCGTVGAVSRTFLGTWVALIREDNGSLVQKRVTDLDFVEDAPQPVPAKRDSIRRR